MIFIIRINCLVTGKTRKIYTKEECIKLIKGATKKVIKDQQRLIDKGMNPKALPDVWID